jgi:hypothetical protein
VILSKEEFEFLVRRALCLATLDTIVFWSSYLTQARKVCISERGISSIHLREAGKELASLLSEEEKTPYVNRKSVRSLADQKTSQAHKP